MTLQVRPMIADDLPALADILNHTVRVGGTTAQEDEVSMSLMKERYLETPIMTHTVCDSDGPVGFQVAHAVGNGLSIASFTDQRNPVRGAGAALFAATKVAAIAGGYPWIDAKIRADNVPGLAYYSKMGFEDFKVDAGVPLKDGTPVDRITKRLML